MWNHSIHRSSRTAHRGWDSIVVRSYAVRTPVPTLCHVVAATSTCIRRSSVIALSQYHERNITHTSRRNGACDTLPSTHSLSPCISSSSACASTISIPVIVSQLLHSNSSDSLTFTAPLTPTILCSITNELARIKHNRAWVNLVQSSWSPLLHSLKASSISSSSPISFTSHLIHGAFEQSHIKQLIQACAKYRDNQLLIQIHDTIIKPQLPSHRYGQSTGMELPLETCSQELFDSLCQLLKAMIVVREFSVAFAIYGNLWQVIEYNRSYRHRQLQLQLEGHPCGTSIPTPIFQVSSMPIEDIIQLLHRPKVGGGLKDEHELIVHLYAALKEEHFNGVMEWVLSRQRHRTSTKSSNIPPPLPPSPISTPLASIVLESLFRSSQSDHRHVIEQLCLLAHAQNQQIRKWKSEFCNQASTGKTATTNLSNVDADQEKAINGAKPNSSISAAADHAEELFPLSQMNYAPFHMVTSLSRISPNFSEASMGHIPALTGSKLTSICFSPSFTSKHDLWSDTRLRPIAKLKLLKFAVESVLIDQLRWNPSLNPAFMSLRQQSSSSSSLSDPFPALDELSLANKFMLPLEFYHVLIRGFLFQGQGALHYAISWFRYLYNRSIDASQGAQFLHGFEHETNLVSQQLRQLQKSRHNDSIDEEEEECMDEDYEYEKLCRQDIRKLDLHPDTWRYAFNLFLRKSASYSHSLNQQNNVRSPSDEGSEYRVSTYTLSPYLLLRHLLGSKFTHSFLKLHDEPTGGESNSAPKLNPLDWYPFWSHLERIRHELSRDLYECSVHQLPLAQRQAIYSDRLKGHSLSSMAGNMQNVTHPNVRLLKTAQQLYVDLEAEYMEAIAKMFVARRFLEIVPLTHGSKQEPKQIAPNASNPFQGLTTAMVFTFPSSLFPTPYSSSGRASLAEYLRLVFRVVQSSLTRAKLQPQDTCLIFDFKYDYDIILNSHNGDDAAAASALKANGTAMRSVRENRWKESMRNEVKNALYQQFLLEPLLLPRLPSSSETQLPARVETRLSTPLCIVSSSALRKWASKDFASFLTPAVLDVSPPNSQEMINRKQRLKPIRIYRDSNPLHQVQESNLPNTYVSNTYYLRIGSHFIRKHFHIASTFDGTSDLQAQANEWKKILRQLKVEGKEIV